MFYRFLRLDEKADPSAVELMSSPKLWERIPHVLSPEAITKLLARSREGTERVKKIVQDLRTYFSYEIVEGAETIHITGGLDFTKLSEFIEASTDTPECSEALGQQLDQAGIRLLESQLSTLEEPSPDERAWVCDITRAPEAIVADLVNRST